MNRLTVRNSEGIGVLKIPFECERCGNLQWSLPDLGNGSPIDRLAEYEDLEEQGRLLKLPCAVGDVVHSFSMGKVLTLRVDSFVIYTDGIDARLISKMKEYEFLKIDMDIEDFGKKWFATQEEAEAALERTKNESNS